MRKLKFIFVMIVLAELFSSCEKDIGPYVLESVSDIKNNNDTSIIIPTVPEPTVYPYTISYGTHIKPMLAQNCVQNCHSPQHPKLDLRPPVSYAQLLTDGFSAPYVNLVTPKQSILYLHLAGVYTLMPQGGPALSQGQIDTVYTWIAQGALNN